MNEQQRSGNQLLAALPATEYERIRPHLVAVELSTGTVLYEPGEPVKYIYFPVTAVVSLNSLTESGSSIELGMTGNEGIVGLSVVLGADVPSFLATVQVPGEALKVRAEVIKEEFRKCGQLMSYLLRHTHAVLVQIAQSAVCNAKHTVEQRLCHWLLITHDRVKSDEIRFTHYNLADMLGTRRATITVAAGKLKEKGLITFSRGQMKVLDRQGLEGCTCECYDIVKAEYGRLYSLPSRA